MKNSTVERFLYIVLLLIFLALGVGGVFLYKLIKDNQRIAKQNRTYTRCVATVFARYTHDFVPVTITNLDKCTVDSQPKTIEVPSTPGRQSTPGSLNVAAPQSQSKVFVSSSQPNNAPTTENNQANANPPDNDGVIIDLPLLPKLHIGSPL